MRACPPLLLEALKREDLTLCRLWELTLVDERVFYYTDLSSPVLFNGNKYISDPGIDISAIRNSVNSGIQNATINLGYTPEAITEPMARFGEVDGAIFKVLVVDYAHIDYGHMEIFAGRVVSIDLTERITCTFNVRGISANNFGKVVGEVYSERCRNVFGDRRCKIDLDALALDFTVTEILIPNIKFKTTVGTVEEGDEPTEPVEPFEESVEFTTVGYHPYTIPPGTSILYYDVVGASGGGGGTGGGASTDGTTAQNTWVGSVAFSGANYNECVVVKGSAGGAKNRNVPFPNSVRPLKAVARPLDYFVAPWVPNIVEESGGQPGGLGLQAYGWLNSAGGDAADSGRAQGAVLVGVGQPLQVGDEISVYVGSGGAGGLTDHVPVNAVPRAPDGTPGAPGIVRLTASRSASVSPIEPTVKTKTAFDLGSILWTKGYNKGRIDSVASNRSDTITLRAETLRQILVGDQGKFRPGCSNYADMCEQKWDNLLNMRAEPVAPQGAGTGVPSPETTPKVDPTKPELQSATPDDSGGLAGSRPANNLPYSAGGAGSGGGLGPA